MRPPSLLTTTSTSGISTAQQRRAVEIVKGGDIAQQRQRGARRGALQASEGGDQAVDAAGAAIGTDRIARRQLRQRIRQPHQQTVAETQLSCGGSSSASRCAISASSSSASSAPTCCCIAAASALSSGAQQAASRAGCACSQTSISLTIRRPAGWRDRVVPAAGRSATTAAGAPAVATATAVC